MSEDVRGPVPMDEAIWLEREHTARNYDPLPIVLATGEGAWLTDTDGNRYFDMLAAYSAANFGHRHPRLVAAANEQLDRLTLTSRAFHNDRLGPFLTELTALAGKEMALPMNTGAEAVETAVKLARAWGYRVKGVPPGRANIVVFSGNFHGRTTTIVSFSDDPVARADFEPFTPGFRLVPYGSATAAQAAMDENTVAVLVEPIQGEAGVIIPPSDFLPALRRACDQRDVLLIADEIQSGLGRTGGVFACEISGVIPDVYLLGKALGGGIVPVSAVVGDRSILGVFRPGEHGSTFGGNPLAAAIGIEVVRMLASGEYTAHARLLADLLAERLAALATRRGVTAVRQAGVWAGVDIDPEYATGRRVCELLARRGVLSKETHNNTIRLAPPIVAAPDDLDWAFQQLADVFP